MMIWMRRRFFRCCSDDQLISSGILGKLHLEFGTGSFLEAEEGGRGMYIGVYILDSIEVKDVG